MRQGSKRPSPSWIRAFLCLMSSVSGVAEGTESWEQTVGEGAFRTSPEPGITGEVSWLNPVLCGDRHRGAEREQALPTSHRTLHISDAELLIPSLTL